MFTNVIAIIVFLIGVVGGINLAENIREAENNGIVRHGYGYIDYIDE